ncbi:hypothetical protein O3S80_45645, partial [Streptomyces sp. Lzd4kr]|nr:hypothetical protein [Streptomyces sp. Lzd4kr]
MDYCHPCRRHLNGALACPGCGATVEQPRVYAGAQNEAYPQLAERPAGAVGQGAYDGYTGAGQYGGGYGTDQYGGQLYGGGYGERHDEPGASQAESAADAVDTEDAPEAEPVAADAP